MECQRGWIISLSKIILYERTTVIKTKITGVN
jgi:hypothetical protein